jgi:hypothetical protein
MSKQAVIVNIYDMVTNFIKFILSKFQKSFFHKTAKNKYLESIGLGIYHSGVVVFGLGIH